MDLIDKLIPAANALSDVLAEHDLDALPKIVVRERDWLEIAARANDRLPPVEKRDISQEIILRLGNAFFVRGNA